MLYTGKEQKLDKVIIECKNSAECPFSLGLGGGTLKSATPVKPDRLHATRRGPAEAI